MRLEIISYSPQRQRSRVPLLFVHGAFCGAWVWEEHFLPYFAANGCAAHALSLRGHGASEAQGQMHRVSLSDYVADLDEAVQRLGVAPILIGHSLGGVVVQRWLKRQEAPGAVLMCSGPPHGMLPSTLRMMFSKPSLFAKIALAQGLGPQTSSVNGMRKALFSDSLPAETVRRHFARGSAESLRVACELAWPDFPDRRRDRDMPMLVLGAENDFFVSRTMVDATARIYGTKAEIFPNTAHAMMLEPHWQAVADRILSWLHERALS